MLATIAHAVELPTVFSQSFAKRRHRPNQANVRSTTHLLGNRTKPSALSERLMISRVHLPSAFRASRSFGPAYPPSAKT